MRILCFLFLFACHFMASAQLGPLGSWRDHLPYSKGYRVAVAGPKLICASESSLFTYDTEDGSILRISKANLLSDVSIRGMAYEPVSATLVVGYANGNIDLLHMPTLTKFNLSDIKRANIVGDKAIYHVFPDPSGGKVFLSTGFGIVHVDIQRREIKDTYYISLTGNRKVNAVTVYNDSLFAATDKGIYKGLASNPFLSDPSSWSKVMQIPPASRDSVFSDIATFGNELVALYRSPAFGRDSVYRYSGSSWSTLPGLINREMYSLQVTDGVLALSQFTSVDVFDASFTPIENIFTYTFSSARPRHAIRYNGFYWIADQNFGLVKALNPWSNSPITPGGPRSASSFDLDIEKGAVWVAPGFVYGSAWLNSYNSDFISGLVDEQWITRAQMSDPLNLMGQDSLFDIMAIAVDPNDPNHVYAGSLSFFGLIELRDGVLVASWDEKNSSLPAWIGRPGYCGVSALEFDREGNLWMAISFTDRPLAVRKKDGTFVSYDLGSIVDGRTYRKIAVGRNSGIKWVAIPAGNLTGGMLAWDDKKTLDDPTDDVFYFYGTGAGNGNLPSADVYTVVEDLDNEIWIGTGAGIAVVYNQNAFSSGSNFDAQRILIQQDGNYQYLLETEVVTAITVDGANRKWVGTDGSGVYLLSEDGMEQIYHFTSENSPLLSNIINDIAIDHLTGEVFFATAQGLISFRGAATIEEKPYDDAYAFPNPVRPEYDGPIVIKGFDRDGDIKITDIAGNVVFVTKSEGGQAVWNGKNLKGERVASGVYTVMGTNPYGKGRAVAKILFIN
jgi:hypothetical protein